MESGSSRVARERGTFYCHGEGEGRITSPPETTLRDAFREWLDSPMPSLDGRTPREAVGEAEGRRRVHTQPLEGLDPAQLRCELEIDEVGQPLANLELARAVGSGRRLSETVSSAAFRSRDTVTAWSTSLVVE